MTTATRTTPPNHDTLTCYTEYRCRLPECVERNNAYDRRRNRAITAGTWQPLLDAEPVRQHLLALHAAGITIYRVAAITGLQFRVVRNFTQHDYNNAASRKRRVTRDVAAKILAVNLADHTPGNVDTTGSRRRVHALMAIGWPLLYTAERAGIHPSNRTVIIARPTIRATTAQRIAAAYDEMRNQQPAKNGVRPTSIKRAKQQAAANRWPTPAYWDETGAIDDPDFIPEYKKLRAEIIAEEAHWLMTMGGLDRDQAAARLGVARFTIDRALREHPQEVAA
ncbi:hypothetical protein [Streptomyces enissocaesilis]|uniref:Uncharacterized protein n=1 Tax=Streptomyces enissocaesilis TaxID=332589 RepID=A0ABN3WYY6_9ACTN